MSGVNLQKPVVQKFWMERDPRVANILHWMEPMEASWLADLNEDEDVNDVLEELLEVLDSSSPTRIVDCGPQLTEVLAYLSSPRAMRLLHWLDERFTSSPSLMAELVAQAREAEEHDATAQLLIERLQILKRFSLLGHVFSPHRVRHLANLLRQDDTGASHS